MAVLPTPPAVGVPIQSPPAGTYINLPGSPQPQTNFGGDIIQVGQGGLPSGPFILLKNQATGSEVAEGPGGNYFGINPDMSTTPYSQNQLESMGFGYTPPEVTAQKDLQKIDPVGWALTQQIENTYGPQIAQAQAQEDLGTSLDPSTIQQIQQYVRGGQVARGNSLGGAQTTEESMTLGQAGLALQQQRQQYLNSVLQQATGYLGSGQTAGAQASTYVNNAINQQLAAFSGYPIPQNSVNQVGPQNVFENPSQIAQLAGQTNAQTTANLYNAGVGATPGSPDTSGQLIGAGVGAAASIGAAAILAFCWVAREALGGEDPRWLIFRDWMRACAPQWLRSLYAREGEKFAERIRDRRRIKRLLRAWILKRLAEYETTTKPVLMQRY